MAVKATTFIAAIDDDDEIPEVTRDLVERERKAQAAQARAKQPTKTRRSWYVNDTDADAFQAVVDDIHHATRRPKHEVVGELLRAAVGQAQQVERRLSAK